MSVEVGRDPERGWEKDKLINININISSINN